MLLFSVTLRGRTAVLRAITLLLLLTYNGQSDVVTLPTVDSANDRCLIDQDASLPPQSSLLQTQRALRSAAIVQTPASVTQLERQEPAQSPIQLFFMKHPYWLLCIILLSILGSLGGMVWAVSWCLDQFEARRWKTGQIGKPWYMDENMVMYVGATALAIWIGIGMFLFTQFVHFYPPLGDARLLTKSEAIYVCVQILTTVGYGDFTPSDTASQACVAAVILVGVVLVATVVTEFLKVLARRTERAIAKFTHRQADAEVDRKKELDDTAHASSEGDDNAAFEEPAMEAQKSLTESRLMEKEKEDQQQAIDERVRMLSDFVYSVAPFALTVLLGTVFFSKYPGEDKSMWQAFYMSCVTLTTVGFGQFTASTEGGKLFSALWMFVGVGATAHMVLSFGNTFLRRHREIQVNQLQYELLAEMDCDGDQRVDKCEFLRFELIRTGLCQKEDIDAIISRFNKLDLDGSGTIDVEDLRAIKHCRVGDRYAASQGIRRLASTRSVA